ncbi:NUDIX hydrolase [Synoicihabitans lomoniglobus]|uniref:NUDIX hydrolase n=1 Tax=Synoicihabitans lomoniglobus TaxID=2909285 RepID=A0AAE9ZVU6_9BACT|nr:NUDIX hydrolase [Opitutaceae bacterium LMO-M01]WED64346.1 NUDIX hydrolase [Opitutaceae bacterium LMO-M01]
MSRVCDAAMLHPWEITASRYIVNDRWLRLRADTCRRQDGLTIDPFYVLEKRDWVHVIPVLPDGRIVLVRQYRHGAGIMCLEFPGGVTEPDEDPLVGAQRELVEECGATGGTWSHVTTFYPNPARQSNQFHCYLARNVEETQAANLDPNEEIEVLRLTPTEIDAAIANGEFSQGNHIAAYLLARSQLVN